MKPLGGTTFVKVDGQQLELDGAAEFPLTDKVREAKTSSTGVAGYTEKHRVPFVKGKYFVPPGFPLEKIKKAENAVVTVNCKNGMNYVLSGAVVVGEPSLNTDEGTVEIEWQGDQGRVI